MEDVKLRAAGIPDLHLISTLAQRIWNQHYPSIIGQDQVNYMLDLMYSAAALTLQMQEKQHRFFLISKGAQDIGFISLHEEEKGNWFLNKFYIDQALSDKGIGSRVFRMILDLLDPKTIRLTVNRGNFKSVNFYFKNGFIIEKTALFDIGNGYVMDDFIMIWNKKEKEA